MLGQVTNMCLCSASAWSASLNAKACRACYASHRYTILSGSEAQTTFGRQYIHVKMINFARWPGMGGRQPITRIILGLYGVRQRHIGVAWGYTRIERIEAECTRICSTGWSTGGAPPDLWDSGFPCDPLCCSPSSFLKSDHFGISLMKEHTPPN